MWFTEPRWSQIVNPQSQIDNVLSSRRLKCLFHDSPIEEMNRAIGMSGIARIVGHHANGSTASMQLAQQFHDGFTIP
jgi:hypothetical protein